MENWTGFPNTLKAGAVEEDRHPGLSKKTGVAGSRN